MEKKTVLGMREWLGDTMRGKPRCWYYVGNPGFETLRGATLVKRHRENERDYATGPKKAWLIGGRSGDVPHRWVLGV